MPSHVILALTAFASLTVFRHAAGDTMPPYNASWTLQDGFLLAANGSKGAFVGTTTSRIMAGLMAAWPKPPSTAGVVVVNSTHLRRLALIGTYQADQTLYLPSQVVLALNGTITAVHNVSGAVIAVHNASYVAIVGGHVTCQGLGPAAAGGGTLVGIQATNAPSLLIEGTNVSYCGQGGTANIHVRGEPFSSNAEIRNVETCYGLNRGIWTETISHVLIHGSHSHHNLADGIDFDAYTNGCMAWNNLLTNNGRCGVFIEEAASNTVTVNNTCIGNKFGISMYDNDAGPSTNNLVFGNWLLNNTELGLSFGARQPPKKDAMYNFFAANTISGNPIGISRNGNGESNYFTGNANFDGIADRLLDISPAEAVIFSPFDRD